MKPGADDSDAPAGWPRRVEAELLDSLAADDPRAIRSRADLQRVNRLMRNAQIVRGALDRIVDRNSRLHLVELGAGDGSLMLQLARDRGDTWRDARLTLIDRQPCVSAATIDAIRAFGWQVDVADCDVFDWLETTASEARPVVVANLFMHHFAPSSLTLLLHGIARRADAFVCCEPRRSRTALGASHLLALLGCNAVTRHDAVVSVHAGFRDRELSALWPESTADARWTLSESAAWPFSHRFVAARASA